jgi:solute carrier family 25 phosphate transporter 3
MLFQGMGPTVSGYFLHGSLKYGFYEVFKPMVSEYIIASNIELGSSLNLCIFVISGALAELISSIVLAPFESLRIRLVAKPGFADGLVSCCVKIINTEGLIALFLGLPAMLTRNVPYTMVQLSTFELLTKSIYSTMEQNGVDNISDFKFVITASSALVAAFFSTIASQPGDTLLSIVNKESRIKIGTSEDDKVLVTPSSNVFSVLKSSIEELGLGGLYVGTKARMLHIAVMLVTQLVVYDYIKLSLGIAVTGSK